MHRVLQKPSVALRWGRVLRALRALDDHWLGDLIGAVCLFGTIILLVVFAGVLS